MNCSICGRKLEYHNKYDDRGRGWFHKVTNSVDDHCASPDWSVEPTGSIIPQEDWFKPIDKLLVEEGGGKMLVVQKYKQNAERFSGITTAVTFESIKRRLRLYFKNIGQVKARLFAGEKIDIPFVTLQKDRRVRDIKVSNDRRRKTDQMIK
jgi:hypothetical protein